MLFGRRRKRIARVLLVEDEPLVAFDNEHLLQENGYSVVATVDRVADAVRVIGEDAPIDLVLVDVDLADGSGIDVARTAHARGVPVMFVTGACPAEAQAFAAGCLSKPYTQRELLAAIDAVDLSLGGEAPRRLPAGFRLFGAS